MSKLVKIRLLKLLHFLISLALFLLAWQLCYKGRLGDANPAQEYVVLFLFFATAMALLMRVYDAYNIGYQRISDCVYAQTLAQFLSAGMLWLFSMVMFMRIVNPVPLLGLCLVYLGWNAAWSFLCNRVYYRLHRRKRTVIVYRNAEDLRRIREIGQLEKKFDIQGYIENPENDFKALEKRLEGFEAIVVSGIEASLRNGIAKYCIDKSVLGYFTPHIGDVIMQGARHLRNFSVPILSVRRTKLTPEFRILKRAFDILVSALALIVLSPVFLLTGIAIKICDRGPVFYKQLRLTQDARQFWILKFRSMRIDAEKDGVARLASEHDDRITPVGRIIRACRIDELPQLINILRGEMSIVGPRPERPEIASAYEAQIPAFALRLQVKAGLTGYAQIYGKYNTDPYDKLEMDLMYINRISVVEDLMLMFATVRILFLKESTHGVACEETITEDSAA